MKPITLYVDAESTGLTLAKYLHDHIDDVTHQQIRVWLNDGYVRIGFKSAYDPNQLVQKKDKITISKPKQTTIQKPLKRKKNRKVTVVYDDRDIVVIDKDSGVLSVPTPRKERDTVIHHINSYIQKRYHKRTSNVFIVHRLDQATSGLLVFAQHESAKEALKRQFIKHDIHRKYAAIVEGVPEPGTRTLSHWLKPNPDNPVQMIVADPKDPDAVEAISNYTVKQVIDERFALLDIRIETGKRNQIRVQMASIGHPVMGDLKYAPKRSAEYHAPQLMLHAMELGFRHPGTDKYVSFHSPLPARFHRFIQRINEETP